MAYEHKENTGTIFMNEKKADNHPDWKGQININGKLLDVAGWIKQGNKGNFISLKVSEPFTREQKDAVQGREEMKKRIVTQDEDNSLPF